MATILVVDDEVEIRQLIVESLEYAGYRVFDAENCEDALALLDLHPDTALLVTDVRMPCCDGPQLAQEALAQHPALQVILITGFSKNGWPWPVLHKPFRMSELNRQVRLALEVAA